jgi:hypothetical protein
VLAAVAVVAAACQSDQDPTVEIPTSVAPSTTTTVESPTSTASGDGPTRPDTTTPVSVPASGTTATLTAVRAARQGQVDRVTFEFSNPVPGYSVKYVNRPITEDGSGDEVNVEGQAVLEVRMEPAHGPSFTPATARIKPATSAVTELVRTGDFEAVVHWVIGVRAQQPFRVYKLDGPPRLVVEIATL